MFEKLDLTELSDADIRLVQEAFSQLALQPTNRLAVDTLVVFLREVCRRHGHGTATDDYTDQELANVMRVLTTAIDAAEKMGCKTMSRCSGLCSA